MRFLRAAKTTIGSQAQHLIILNIHILDHLSKSCSMETIARRRGEAQLLLREASSGGSSLNRTDGHTSTNTATNAAHFFTNFSSIQLEIDWKATIYVPEIFIVLKYILHISMICKELHLCGMQCMSNIIHTTAYQCIVSIEYYWSISKAMQAVAFVAGRF